MVEEAYKESAPHKVCAYIYDLANVFNRFYHETKIISQEDTEKKAGWVALLLLTRRILETCIEMLGFSAPESMKEIVQCGKALSGDLRFMQIEK